MDFKKTAINLKNRAKELGYDLKLTHAQELLALTKGFTNRHAALKSAAELGPTIKLVNDFKINKNCQCCEQNPRARVHAIYTNKGTDLWYLCLECVKPNSKYSLENGAKDLTSKYPLDVVCLRDMNFQSPGKARSQESFLFQLICSDNSLGDIYQFVPGLNMGSTTLSLLNISKNKLEPNGWYYWPIIPILS